MSHKEQGIQKINVRFFVEGENEDFDLEIVEVNEAEFLDCKLDKIEYERHSIFENGCRQICLTKRQ